MLFNIISIPVSIVLSIVGFKIVYELLIMLGNDIDRMRK